MVFLQLFVHLMNPRWTSGLYFDEQGLSDKNLICASSINESDYVSFWVTFSAFYFKPAENEFRSYFDFEEYLPLADALAWKAEHYTVHVFESERKEKVHHPRLKQLQLDVFFFFFLSLQQKETVSRCCRFKASSPSLRSAKSCCIPSLRPLLFHWLLN